MLEKELFGYVEWGAFILFAVCLIFTLIINQYYKNSKKMDEKKKSMIEKCMKIGKIATIIFLIINLILASRAWFWVPVSN